MEATQLLTLSNIRTIAPAQIHPEAQEAERIIEEYCDILGIKLPHFQEYTTMSSYLFPRTSVERLVAIDIFTNLLYFIDDVWDRNTEQGQNVDQIEIRKVFENCYRAMRYGIVPPDEHVLYPTCLELNHQFMALGSEAWTDRLCNNLLQHLKSTVYSIDDIMNKGGDAVDEYLKIRELDCGMRPTINLIELAYGMYMPDELLQHPFIRQMTTHTAMFGGLTNDVFSYEKEVIRYGSRFNLVSVMMESQNLSFLEAIHECILLFNRLVEDFLEDERSVPDWGDDETNDMVRQYIQGLKDQMIATIHWQLSSNRYRSLTSPFPELREML